MARGIGNFVSLSLNFLSLIVGTYGLNSILDLELPPHLLKAGHWQFLTNISLLFSLVVFSLGIAAHLLKLNDIFRLRSVLHPVVLTLESVVTVVYWPLRLFWLPMLVKDSQRLIPWKVDVSVHLVPFAALLVDFLFFMPRWTIPTAVAFFECILLTFLYWVHLSFLVDEASGASYPYEFLNGESNAVRGIIFVVIGLLGFGMFVLIKRIYDIVAAEKENRESIKDIGELQTNKKQI